jgi:hypothetical protein
MSNVVKKVGGAIGIGPKKKAPSMAVANLAATAAGTSVEEMAGKLTAQKAARSERAAAAKRRGRRAGRRGLMMAGRLGGGGEQEETKTTLGA